MLKLFRKKAVTKFVLWSLLILILPAFVMWGSASMSRSKDKGPNYVGIVDGKKISFEALYAAILGVRCQIILNYFNQPQILDALLNNRSMVAKVAWDRILLLNEAKKLKIKIPDKEVIGSIKKHPLFLRNGVFDDKFYSYMLRNNIGMEARSFEEIVRENLIIQKLSSYLAKDQKITNDEVLDEYNKEFSKIKIAYILMEPEEFINQVKVEETAIKEFYEKNKSGLIFKSNLKGAVPDRVATFEEARATIEKNMKEAEARKILKSKADETRKEILKRMGEKNETFTEAGTQLKLVVKNTGFFSGNDKLDEIGDIPLISYTGANLKESEISEPLEITKGFIIFEVAQRQDPDIETFKKEEAEYSKKVTERRSNLLMEDRLRALEKEADLAINLEEIDKYYK